MSIHLLCREENENNVTVCEKVKYIAIYDEKEIESIYGSDIEKIRIKEYDPYYNDYYNLMLLISDEPFSMEVKINEDRFITKKIYSIPIFEDDIPKILNDKIPRRKMAEIIWENIDIKIYHLRDVIEKRLKQFCPNGQCNELMRKIEIVTAIVDATENIDIVCLLNEDKSLLNRIK